MAEKDMNRKDGSGPDRGVSRRDFLKGAAAGVIGVAAEQGATVSVIEVQPESD